jgi:transcriptional regulator with XRE-family HTH domain
MQQAIANELKATRLRKNLKAKYVAADLNISEVTLGRYEKDAAGLSVEQLERMLSYYKVPKSIFFRNVCEYMHENY